MAQKSKGTKKKAQAKCGPARRLECLKDNRQEPISSKICVESNLLVLLASIIKE